MSQKEDIIFELKEIFPQYSEDLIGFFYDDMLTNIGGENYSLVLASCIERMLDLPDNIVPLNYIFNSIELKNKTKQNILKPSILNTQLYMPDSTNAHNYFSEKNTDEDSLANLSLYRDKSIDKSNKSLCSKNVYNNLHCSNQRYQERHALSNSSTFPCQDNSISSSLNEVEILEHRSTKRENMNFSIYNKYNLPLVYDRASGDEHSLIIEQKKRKYDKMENFSVQKFTLKKSCLDNVVNHQSSVVTLPTSKTLTPEVDASALVKGMNGFMYHTKKAIISVIEDVDETFLEQEINSLPHELTLENAVNNVLHHLLDIKNYPKCSKKKPVAEVSKLQQSTSSIKSLSVVNNSASICSSTSVSEYNRQSVQVLQNQFGNVSTAVIRKVFYGEGASSFPSSYNLIYCNLKEIKDGKKNVSESFIHSFLKKKRKSISLTSLHPKLEKEFQDLNKCTPEGSIDVYTNSQNSEENLAVECSCCYNDVKFEDMIQCLEGHLFCQNCLRQYSNEAMYGSGKLQLFCMADACTSLFPLSQLQKVLSEKELEKYHERVQEEDIKLANLDNLVRCPGCDFAAEMPEGDKVFRCQNEACMKETCRHCKVEWEDHFGLPCAEVENKSETSLRKSYEEKMTQAKVRKCWKCETIFLKTDGCNKMTCRCGSTMCYICRESKINYEHFCQHPRNPGQNCAHCKKCSLWTDPAEDDDREIAAIKQEAEKERMKLTGGNAHASKITVGPSFEVKNVPTVINQIPQVQHNIPVNINNDQYLINNLLQHRHNQYYLNHHHRYRRRRHANPLNNQVLP